MSALAAQQQALLGALFTWPSQNAIKNIAVCADGTGARGLKAYQNNGRALARRVLQAAYPVLEQMLGAESFANLAQALWHAHPPVCGDLGRWGDALPAFVRDSAQLCGEPYLHDVAAAEWALHRCAWAADLSPDLPSLVLLTHQAPERLSLVLAPGCTVLQSTWPLASLLGAHREHAPSLEAVGRQLRDAVAQDLLVWRQGLRPCARQALAGERALVHGLLQGRSLAHALDQAPALDFGQWFPMAVQSGLVLGATVLAEEHEA